MTPELTQRTALRALGVLLVLALVVPFVIFAVPQAAGADSSFVVLSGSMEPAISVGDAVVVAEVDGDDVRVGDVITYVTADRAAPTTHRVIEIQQTAAGPEFVTQGDNNEDPDASTVTPDRLVGRVMLTIPFIGYVVQFVGTTTGFALLVATPIALLVVTELWSLYKRRTGGDESVGGDSEPVSDGTASAAAVATDEEPAGWSIGVRDLTVTMAVVGVAAVYSGVVAYLVYDGSVTYLRLLQLSVAAFAAFAVGFLVLLGMRVFVTPTNDTQPVAGGVLRGSLDETTRSLPTVTVASVDELRSMATAAERWIVHDEERDRLSYSDGTMLYVCEVPDDDDHAIAAVDESVTEEATVTDDSVLGEADDSALDDEATGDWTVVDDAVDTEEAAWAALFGDAFEHDGGEFSFPTRDARPDGGAEDEQ
jgi:signal peptidase I